MSNELWIKIGLVGADPQLGTLQGRISIDESFSETVSCDENEGTEDIENRVDSCIHLNIPFKLFDPIIFRAHRGPNGETLLGAAALAKSMPPISTDYLTINPANIMWWAPIKESRDWDQVVASTISGLDLAGGGELSIEMPEGPGFVD